MGLKQRLVKPLQILLPFHGKQLLFGRVAFLTARCHIASSAFTTPGYRDNVIHGQFFRQGWPAAIVAHPFGQTAFPPLGSSKLPSFVTRPFQIFFAHIIGERLGGFFSFHFWHGWLFDKIPPGQPVSNFLQQYPIVFLRSAETFSTEKVVNFQQHGIGIMTC